MRRPSSFLFSSLLLFFARPASAEHRPLPIDGGFCERALRWVDDFVTDRDERLVAEYSRGKEIYAHVLNQRSDAIVVNTAAAQKLGLFSALLEAFFGRSISTRIDAEFIRQTIKASALKNGELTRLEVERGLLELITHFDKPPQDHRNFLHRYLLSDWDQDLRRKVEVEVLRDPELAQQMASLAVGPIFNRNKELTTALARNGVALARSLLINSALIFLAIPIIDLPNIKTLALATLDTSVVVASKNQDLHTASRIAGSQMGVWAKIHQRYRGVRKIYYASLLTLAFGYLAWHPEILAAPVNSWLTGYQLHHMSTQDLRNTEQQHYTPHAVIEEQLQSWLEAQDEAPSPKLIEEKRQELEEQEREGVLRVFNDEKR